PVEASGIKGSREPAWGVLGQQRTAVIPDVIRLNQDLPRQLVLYAEAPIRFHGHVHGLNHGAAGGLAQIRSQVVGSLIISSDWSDLDRRLNVRHLQILQSGFRYGNRLPAISLLGIAIRLGRVVDPGAFGEG